MSPKLKPLLLPQLVEERRKRESLLDSEMDLSSSSFYSQTSSASDVPSPVTPTFSNRGHLRYPSSASSIESTFHTSTTDSPSSPTFASSKTGKRSLPDVQEEPQERDEDFDMFDDASELYDCLCKSSYAAPSVVNKPRGNIANACNNRR
jgi:carbohydrate-binding DOMON domain-containing protein